jgi:hypothetical protein
MTRMRIAVALYVTIATLAVTGVAHAGSYAVTGTCGLWQPFNNNGDRVAVYASGGCLLIARNSYGNFTSAQGTQGGWTVSAPAGATITAFTYEGFLKGTEGWDAALYADNGLTYAACPGGTNCEGSNARILNYSSGPINATQLAARVRCYKPTCTNTGGPDPYMPQRAYLTIGRTSITIADSTTPSVAFAGGAASSGGWERGTPDLTLDASDNVGIRRYDAFVDGHQVGTALRSDCSDVGRIVPCPNGAGTVGVQLAGIADGMHTLTGQAVDSAGNAGGVSRQIQVDNTPPVAATDATVAGGATWHTTSGFTLRWTNPPQRFAPIAAARYELCPPSADSSDPKTAAQGRRQCVRGSRSGRDVHEITGTIPREGAWNVRRLWLVDEAGNENPDGATRINGLGFDATPPTDVAFLDEDPAAPAQLNVRARDDASGIAGGTIEARRSGEQAWRPLSTSVAGTGLTARIDDERLPRGVYDLRAVAFNAAGLQQGTDRRADGLPARIRLPVRARSRLVAGKPAGRDCRRVRRHGRGHRICHRRLSRSPRVPIGRPALLRGRLTVAGKPLADRRVRVSRRLVGQRGWKQLRVLHTSRTGRFRYRAPRGPARTIRFRYPGGAKIRGDNAPVELQVPASSTMRASRRLVVTGEYVTFSGTLKGGWIPPAGTLVELQVYNRGTWRTFAQPRASRNGRWRYQYRFETVRGSATFRFRARIRRQAEYPFVTGHSRPIRIRVRGLQ